MKLQDFDRSRRTPPPLRTVVFLKWNRDRHDAPDQCHKPTDVAFAPAGIDAVYVTDGYGNSRVMKFTMSGRLLTTWGTPGQGDDEFHLPQSILLDAEGRVLVGDRENDRIQVFDSEGLPLEIWKGFAPTDSRSTRTVRCSSPRPAPINC